MDLKKDYIYDLLNRSIKNNFLSSNIKIKYYFVNELNLKIGLL